MPYSASTAAIAHHKHQGLAVSVPALWLDRTSRGYVESITTALIGGSARTLLVQPHTLRHRMAGDGRRRSRPVRASQEPELAPTCRRCLTTLDRHFPDPEPDERIGLLAILIAEAVEEHGSAEVLGVPGDQLKALRAATRRELRRRLGADGKTYVRDDFLLVTCNEATEQVRLAKAHEIVRSMHLGIAERPHLDGSEWRLHWHTWSAP